jgi:hypothetical protein
MILSRIWFALILAIAATAAGADGRIYASSYAPEIADQRALIAFDGARQVMLIENRISLLDGRPISSLGWVVPVPALPEIAVVTDRTSLRRFYQRLRAESDPDPLPVVPFVLALVPFAIVYARRLRKQEHPDARTLNGSIWIGIVGSVLAVVSLPAPLPSGPDSGVEVVKALRSGPLDAKVVRATSGAELVDWLKVNGFEYHKADVAAIDDYLRRKWLFVVWKLVPQPGGAFEGQSASPPLVLSFPTRQAVYPLALTAAGGRGLDLVLYVCAPTRMEPSVAMHTTYAGAFYMPTTVFFKEEDKAAVALFDALRPMPDYLTKLVRKLSADEMRQDIHFIQAAGKGNFKDWTVGPMFTFWIGGAFIVALVAALLQRVGGARWRSSSPAWFAMSMFLSPLALVILLVSVHRQYKEYRKTRDASTSELH